ncbi:MAG: hypothetical protein WAQ33_06155 [Gaiellaceae bacterium]
MEMLALSFVLLIAVFGLLIGWAFREDRRRRQQAGTALGKE